jgi:hypothetical protein
MYDDLELRLAIGLIELEGGQVLMCGPETAFTSRVARTISIQPGDEEPRAVARKIAAGLGCDLEEAARLLPPGKSQVILPA